MALTVTAAQAQLAEIARMAMDHTEAGRDLAHLSGGAGRIGLINGQVVKFNTHFGERIHEQRSSPQLKASCDALRASLLEIATTLLRGPDGEDIAGPKLAVLNDIRRQLGMAPDGRVTARGLLDRKVVVSLMKTLNAGLGTTQVADMVGAIDPAEIRALSSRMADGKTKLDSSFAVKFAALTNPDAPMPKNVSDARAIAAFKRCPAAGGNVRVDLDGTARGEIGRRMKSGSLDLLSGRTLDVRIDHHLGQLRRDYMRGFEVFLGGSRVEVPREDAQGRARPDAAVAADLRAAFEAYFTDAQGTLDRRALLAALASSHQGAVGAMIASGPSIADRNFLDYLIPSTQTGTTAMNIVKGDGEGHVFATLRRTETEAPASLMRFSAAAEPFSPKLPAGSSYTEIMSFECRVKADDTSEVACHTAIQHFNIPETAGDRSVRLKLEQLCPNGVPDEIGWLSGDALREKYTERLVAVKGPEAVFCGERMVSRLDAAAQNAVAADINARLSEETDLPPLSACFTDATREMLITHDGVPLPGYAGRSFGGTEADFAARLDDVCRVGGQVETAARDALARICNQFLPAAITQALTRNLAHNRGFALILNGNQTFDVSRSDDGSYLVRFNYHADNENSSVVYDPAYGARVIDHNAENVQDIDLAIRLVPKDGGGYRAELEGGVETAYSLGRRTSVIGSGDYNAARRDALGFVLEDQEPGLCDLFRGEIKDKCLPTPAEMKRAFINVPALRLHLPEVWARFCPDARERAAVENAGGPLRPELDFVAADVGYSPSEKTMLAAVLQRMQAQGASSDELRAALRDPNSLARRLLAYPAFGRSPQEIAQGLRYLESFDRAMSGLAFQGKVNETPAGRIPAGFMKYVERLCLEELEATDAAERPETKRWAGRLKASANIFVEAFFSVPGSIRGRTRIPMDGNTSLVRMCENMPVRLRRPFLAYMRELGWSGDAFLQTQFCRHEAAIAALYENGTLNRESVYRLLTGDAAGPLPPELGSKATPGRVGQYLAGWPLTGAAEALAARNIDLSNLPILYTLVATQGLSASEAADVMAGVRQPLSEREANPYVPASMLTIGSDGPDDAERSLAMDLCRMTAGYSWTDGTPLAAPVAPGSSFTFRAAERPVVVDTGDLAHLQPADLEAFAGGKRSSLSKTMREQVTALCGRAHPNQISGVLAVLAQGGMATIRAQAAVYGVRADEHSQAVYDLARQPNGDVTVAVSNPPNCPLDFHWTVTVRPNGTQTVSPQIIARA